MEKLTKSEDRVKKFGEVYTPLHIVNKMLDMLEEENPEAFTDISKTFLEPACGNGNFLVEIYKRKLKICKSTSDGLKALESIYGIDILEDNVEESRERLFEMFVGAYKEITLRDILLAETILEKNIICGDSLKIMKKWAEEEENKERRERK